MAVMAVKDGQVASELWSMDVNVLEFSMLLLSPKYVDLQKRLKKEGSTVIIYV